jgi:3-keto-L-gulonate-6-phosphate decarboxylase
VAGTLLQVDLPEALGEALHLADLLRDYADGFGLSGTGGEGALEAAGALRARYPGKPICLRAPATAEGATAFLACLAGRAQALRVFGDLTVDALRSLRVAAHEHQVRLLVDLTGLAEAAERARRLSRAKPDAFLLEVARREAGRADLDLGTVAAVREAADRPVAIAADLEPAVMPQVLRFRPERLIVGRTVTGAPDPPRAANALKARIEAVQRLTQFF